MTLFHQLLESIGLARGGGDLLLLPVFLAARPAHKFRLGCSAVMRLYAGLGAREKLACSPQCAHSHAAGSSYPFGLMCTTLR